LKQEGKVMRWISGLLSGLLVAAVAGVYASELPPTRDPETHFFEQGFGELNLKDELAQAKAAGKRGVIIMFDDPDCPWCHKMKTTVFNQVRVQDAVRRDFRVLHVNTRGGESVVDVNGKQMLEKEFAEQVHRVRATPVFLFLGLDGQILTRYTGATRDVDEFLWLAEYVASGEHGKRPFVVYKREREQGAGAPSRRGGDATGRESLAAPERAERSQAGRLP
jgi:thioredoxin-related protein